MISARLGRFLTATLAAAVGIALTVPADAAHRVTRAKPRITRAQQQAQHRAMIARGEYLVSMAGCGNCHTPGYFFGHADRSRYLAGSDVGFAVPKKGVFVAPNLTPDPETGLGKWTREEIITAFTKGVRPDGQTLSPIMPWRDYARFTRADALAIADYLQSLKPVKHAVPGRFGPDENVSGVYVMTLLSPGVYNGAPKPERDSSAQPNTASAE